VFFSSLYFNYSIRDRNFFKAPSPPPESRSASSDGGGGFRGTQKWGQFFLSGVFNFSPAFGRTQTGRGLPNPPGEPSRGGGAYPPNARGGGGITGRQKTPDSDNYTHGPQRSRECESLPSVQSSPQSKRSQRALVIPIPSWLHPDHLAEQTSLTESVCHATIWE